jgi:hypothetical protein
MSDQSYSELQMEQQITPTLCATVRYLFPDAPAPEALVKRHVWRDEKYVGEHEGRIVAWRGQSVNFAELDPRYRTVYIDVVENVLPRSERVQLFGPDFAAAIAGMACFVVIFVLDFSLDSVPAIKALGFTPRVLTRVAHACKVVGVQAFLTSPPSHWAAQAAKLLMMQRLLAIHRKPFDLREGPLQALLYRLGYLRAYLSEGGIQLQALRVAEQAEQGYPEPQARGKSPVADYQRIRRILDAVGQPSLDQPGGGDLQSGDVYEGVLIGLRDAILAIIAHRFNPPIQTYLRINRQLGAVADRQALQGLVRTAACEQSMDAFTVKLVELREA